MESLAFVAGLAALLAALHVAVAAYLYRAATSGEGLEALREAGESGLPSPNDDGLDVDGETVGCPVCGTPNDPSYRFCRHCVADLSGSGSPGGGAVAGRLGS
jgi:hypothetical protein